MTTRWTNKISVGEGGLGTGFEGSTSPVAVDIESCSLEDIDRSIFKLFNEEIPLYYEAKSVINKIPVIFATGERFAVLRKKQPLRDQNNTLILPLVSIMRTNAELGGTGMPMSLEPIAIRRRLSADDPRYQRLINRLGLQNAYDTSSDVPYGSTLVGSPKGVQGTRRTGFAEDAESLLTGISPSLKNNLFETIEIPPPKAIKVTYDITFWSQYTSQMNSMLSAVTYGYINPYAREFRLETDKGYWFSATVDSQLAAGNNFDDFSSEERIVKYSFSMTVNGYIVEPSIPGAPSGVRSHISAPTINFELVATSAVPIRHTPIASSNIDTMVLSEIETADDPNQGQAIGVSQVASSEFAALGESSGEPVVTTDSRKKTTSIGSTSTGPGTEVVTVRVSDGSGGTKEKYLKVRSKNVKKGETVIRGEPGSTFEDIII